MGRRRQGEDNRESWYGVQDPKERKRIQDRLAQRARRRKLANASETSKTAIVDHSARSTMPVVEIKDGSERSERAIVPGLKSISFTSPTTSYGSAQRSLTMPIHPSCKTRDLSISDDHRLLMDPRKTAWIAFDENGQRMGIKNLCVGLVCSWRQPPDVPETLQPTPLQLTTPHPIWLDRLPFPRLRDNIILLIQMIDVEDFYVDLILKQSFHIDTQKASHDPSAYRIDSAFRAKWGYLFV